MRYERTWARAPYMAHHGLAYRATAMARTSAGRHPAARQAIILSLILRLLTHSLPFSSVCHHHELQLPQTRLLAMLLRDSKRGTWELQEISEFLQLFCPVY